jgi:PhnB protein
MDAITPYVHFQGNCAEALEFYGKILGGKILFSMPFGQGPMNVGEEAKDKIMHAHFQAGHLNLFASDCPPDFKIQQGNNTELNLNFADVESLDKAFEAFSEGATIRMPVQNTFWGARFGMLTDKFGINWMFNTNLPKEN